MLHLIYEESRSGGEVCQGQEQDSYPDREDEYIDWRTNGVSLTTKQYDGKLHTEFTPTKGQVVYVPYVRYSDGDTFGTTRGHWAVWQAFLSKEEAEENLKRVLRMRWDEPDHRKWPQHWPYPSWTGYFGSLSSSGVLVFTVED